MKKLILKILVFFAVLICCFPTTIKAAAVARVESSGAEYDSLQEAINAADPAGDTVTLLSDITVPADEYIGIVNQNLTLDGNGYIINYLGSGPNKFALYIQSKQDVTIRNLDIYAEDAEAGIFACDSGDLALESVEVSGGGGSGVPDMALLMNAGTSYANVSITGSHLEGRYAMYIFGEHMNIDIHGSTIRSIDDSFTKDFAAIILNAFDNYYTTNGTVVNITGYSNIIAYKEDSTLSNAVINASVTGVVNIDPSVYVEGHIVYPVAVAAKNASTYNYHYSLQDAVDAVAGTDWFVGVLRDIDINSPVNINDQVTIDGNGYTLTSSYAAAIVVDANDEVTIKNFKIVGNPGGFGISIKNNPATLKLDNVNVSVENGLAVSVDATASGATVSIEKSSLSGVIALTIWGEGAQVEVKNSELTGDNNRSYVDPAGYGTIDIHADDVSVGVFDGSITAKAQEGKQPQAIVCVATGFNNVHVYLATELLLEGTAKTVSIDPADTPLIAVREQYKQQLNNEGYGVTPPDVDHMIYIDYSIEVFDVTYVADGATVAVIGVQNGEDVADPPAVPPKSGYTGAWDHDGTNITADTTITAVYTKDAVPPTGDNINITMWVIVMLISAAGVFGVIVYVKKKKLF